MVLLPYNVQITYNTHLFWKPHFLLFWAVYLSKTETLNLRLFPPLRRLGNHHPLNLFPFWVDDTLFQGDKLFGRKSRSLQERGPSFLQFLCNLGSEQKNVLNKQASKHTATGESKSRSDWFCVYRHYIHSPDGEEAEDNANQPCQSWIVFSSQNPPPSRANGENPGRRSQIWRVPGWGKLFLSQQRADLQPGLSAISSPSFNLEHIQTWTYPTKWNLM